MLSGAEARARRIAEERTRGLIVQLAARIEAELPDTVATPAGDAILIATRIGLDDARLRWIASLLK
jgi:hypothetical protein